MFYRNTDPSAVHTMESARLGGYDPGEYIEICPHCRARDSLWDYGVNDEGENTYLCDYCNDIITETEIEEMEYYDE